MVVVPRARRGCSHPAVDLHGRCRDSARTSTSGGLVGPPSSDRPTGVARRDGVRSHGFRKRVRAGKTSDESSIILRVVPGARNGGADSLVREALSRQVTRRLRSRASARHDALGARTLALERRHRILDELGGDTRAQQVVTDERVARATIGEPFRARLREAAIVDESCPRERRERFDSFVLGDASRRELVVDLRGAAIAMAQGPQRRLDGVARPARRRFSSRRGPPLRSRPPRRSPQAPEPGGAALR